MVQLKTISASQSASSITFSPEVRIVTIKNVGSNPVYFQINNTATTNHFRLDVEETIEIGLKGIETVSAICDNGKTSKLDIIGNIK